MGDKTNINIPDTYTLWIRDSKQRDWSIKGYTKACEIKTASDFWQVYNNFEKLGLKSNQFFLMKTGIDPIWECEDNKHGGRCSFKVDSREGLKAWEYLSALMVCRQLNNNDHHDINGISINPKYKTMLIKIWNRDNKKDLLKTIDQEVIKKYSKCSIQYTSHKPEF